MKRSRFLVPIALLVFLGSLLVIGVHLVSTSPRVDRRIHEALGRAMAQEALKLLGNSGNVLVISRDTSTFPQPAMDFALEQFTQEVRRAGATLKVTKTLQEDPLRPVQVPAGDFHELLRRAAVGDVIVSFMGPPLLFDEQRAKLGDVKPKVVAFCPGMLVEQLDLRALGEQGLLHAAVVARPVSQLSQGKESFEDLYARVSGPAWTMTSVSKGTR